MGVWDFTYWWSCIGKGLCLKPPSSPPPCRGQSESNFDKDFNHTPATPAMDSDITWTGDLGKDTNGYGNSKATTHFFQGGATLQLS